MLPPKELNADFLPLQPPPSLLQLRVKMEKLFFVCSLLAGAMVPAFCWHQAGSLALSQQVPALHHFLLFSFLLPAMKYGSRWLRGYRTRAETKTQQQAQHQYKVHPVGGRSGDVNGEKGAVRKSAKMRDSQTCCILFYQCSGAQSEWWNSQHQHNNHRQWHSAQMDCTFFISFRFDSISFSSLALTLASLFLSIVLHFYFLFSFFSLQLDLPSRGILLLFLP